MYKYAIMATEDVLCICFYQQLLAPGLGLCSSLLLNMQTAVTTGAAAAAVRQIFAFPNASIENLQMLSNGNILLSTLDSDGLLYTLDPGANQPEAKPVASFENATGLTGIASLSDNLYAVSGGVYTSSSFEEGLMYVYSGDGHGRQISLYLDCWITERGWYCARTAHQDHPGIEHWVTHLFIGPY